MTAIICIILLSLIALIIPTQQARDPTCGDAGYSKNTLKLAVFIFRHGDRTAYNTYPTDPYQEDYWKQWGGFGQLTQDGMLQHYNFGRWVRNCYEGFLSDLYNPREVLVRSTDFDRTLQSAYSHLSGIYPPHDWQQWGDAPVAKQWMPIPVHTMPRQDDYILIPEVACPPYDALITNVWATNQRIKKIQKDNQALLDYISKNAGLGDHGDIYKVQEKLCDAIFVEKVKKLPLPGWITPEVSEKLELWKEIWLIVRFATDEMVRYAAGPLIHHMGELFLNKSQGSVRQKHIVYSGHDTSISALLSAYGDFDRISPQKRPPYASSMITELHHDEAEDKWFVKAFYRNYTTSEPIPLRIRNCRDPSTNERCYLDEYVKVLKPLALTIQQKREFCWGKQSSDGLDTNSIIAIAVTSSLVGLLVIATVIFLLMPVCTKRKQPDGH